MKYLKAPVAEVIIGITYNREKFDSNVLFHINDFLSKEYPITEFLPPLANEFLDGFKVVESLNQSLTGPVLYRRREEELRWLVQIQGNKLYLNWSRNDDEREDGYAGFDVVRTRFVSLVASLHEATGIDLYEDVEGFDLTYQDRFIYQDYIESLKDIGTIMNVGIPLWLTGDSILVTNINSQYTYHNKDVRGYGIMNVNTATHTATQKQILRFESILRGTGDSFVAWIEKAHTIQGCIFDAIFATSQKEKWV